MEWWTHVLLILFCIALAYWYFSDDRLHTLKGKRVLVTGSSAGLGKHLALHYARLGASVVVTGRRVETLNKIVQECHALSPSNDTKHFSVPADMTNKEDVKRVVEQAVKLMGGLDILALNHIKMPSMKIFVGEPEDQELLDATMDLNFRSYVYVTSHALPQLVANNGSIIIANSILSLVPTAFFSSETAAKCALTGYFSSLRSQFIELGQDISVTNCYIGLVGVDEDTRPEKQELVKPTAHLRTSPAHIALDMIKGGVRRQKQVFTPYLSSRPMPLLSFFFPDSMDALFRRGMRMNN